MGQFEFEKLRQTLSVLRGAAKKELSPVEAWFRPGKLDFRRESELHPFGRNETWGGWDCDGWFRFYVEIPEEWDGLPLRLELETGRELLWNAVNPQFLVYVNGEIRCAIDTNHRGFYLAMPENQKRVLAGERYVIDLDAWSGMVTKPTANAHGNGNEPIWTRGTVVSVEPETDELCWNLAVPYDIAEQLPAEDYRRVQILKHLTAAVNLLDLRKIGSPAYLASVQEANQYLKDNFYGNFCGNTEGKADCIGHTHIDVAWQWTYDHTRRKAARSFATVLQLHNEYPEYRFMSSQPQLYEFVKEDHPALFERIREQVKNGMWEAEGGMWVEADCNLTSGESLVRQFLYGKRFFREEFGVDSRILWLPDVFGYSAALPQICKKCGVDYFMTTKLSWNDTNKFPYDTFIWKGIDGTELLTHFVSTRDYIGKSKIVPANKERNTTYNGILDAKQVMGGWERYQQKDLNDYFLLSYGYGDGGGGTTPEMLENARRLAYGIPGCPQTRQTKSLDFFRRLEADVSKSSRLPCWFGELYLEFHRGTYTSMAKNKRNNRKAEIALATVEALSAMEKTLLPQTAVDTKETLDACWKKVLLNQFHDVLPGSCIRPVYEDTDRIYSKVFTELHYLSDSIRSRMASRISRSQDSLLVWNPLGWRRSGYVQVAWPANYDAFHLEAASGERIPVQRTVHGQALFYAPEIPSMGYATFKIHPGQLSSDSLHADLSKVENPYLCLRFNEAGQIYSIFDREAQRELLPEGEIANRLESYEDRPHCYDAWEIELYHKEKVWLLDAPACFALVENGPHRAVYHTEYQYLDSKIEQDIIVYAKSRRIDFVTTADWHEQHILLKAAFPTELLAASASFEVQFGAVERPTHYNTSWDTARFETCAQKWADLSEADYGAALLNDCKYGYDIHDNVLRLSLIKAATFPNEVADQGRHAFTYSLLPHIGGWRQGEVSRQSYDLNRPLQAQLLTGEVKGLPSRYSWMECGENNIVAETLKPAEDGGDMILRLFEAYGQRTRCTVKVGANASDAWECDLLEQPTEKAVFSNGELSLLFHPFEIKTIRFSLNRS